MAGKDDEESFMSLEDEVVKPIKSKTQKRVKKPVEKASEKGPTREEAIEIISKLDDTEVKAAEQSIIERLRNAHDCK